MARSSPELMTQKQAAEYLTLASSTLANDRTTMNLRIPYIRLSNRAIRYRRADLDKWLEDRLVSYERKGGK